MGRPKKITEEQENPPESVKRDYKAEVRELLNKKMSGCFDREPQGMNSNVDKLVLEITNLFNK